MRIGVCAKSLSWVDLELINKGTAAEIRAATAITTPSLLNGSKNLLAQLELIKKMLSLKEAATTAATSGRWKT